MFPIRCPTRFAIPIAWRAACTAGLAALAAVAVIGRAATPTPPTDIVELEKLRVDERGLGRPYLYVAVPGFELLSPFGESLTRAYALELQRQRVLLSRFIPDLATSNYDTPQAILVDDQPPVVGHDNLLIGRSYALPEGVVRQSLNAIRGVPVDQKARAAAGGRATITWSRALSADSVVSYTSIFGYDYARQSGAGQVVAAPGGLSHVFPLASLYEHRRPRWPSWLEDALADLGPRFFSAQTLQFFMFVKLTPPPPDLKIESVFAPHRGDDPIDLQRARRQAAAVLVNWALVGSTSDAGMTEGSPHQGAFWRFANQAGREPVTEEMFARYFGEGAWETVRREWSKGAADQARTRTAQSLGTYWPQVQPAFPTPVVRRATRAELVRVKSEYEWRIGREFAAAAPELARQCLDQAGRRLRQAYADGERDPQFLAVFALFEADAGKPEDARRLIDEAAATGVIRPRVYFHQARFRYLDEAAQLAGPDGKFSLDQARRILAPLERTFAQRPALGEAYRAAAEVWLRCATPPDREDLEKLVAGPQLFPRDAVLAQYVATLLLQAGLTAEAKEVVAQAQRATADEPGSAERWLRLSEAIERARAKAGSR